MYKPVPKGLSPTTMITIICVVVAVSICILVIACFAHRCYKYIKRFANYKYPVFDLNRLPENPLFGKDLSRSYNPKLQYLEYPRNDIVYMRDIGEGAFGRVFLAITPHLMREEEKSGVAIKMLKKDAERNLCDCFNREAEIMSQFNHRNIIQLLGICFVGKPFCLILEYMEQGDMYDFLQSHHPYSSYKRIKNALPKHTINNKVQLEMAQQVACGLVYLTEKRFVHRDIAARNCLVNNNMDVKISDFGLAQYLGENNEYVGNEYEQIPIRWTAPEALWQYHFTTFSDMWSFGVLLWEIFSYAQLPYASLSFEQVFIQTYQGHTLSKPSNTPSSVYYLMRRCWALDSTQRPTFHTVVDTLNQIKEMIEASPESSSPSTSVVSIESSSESCRCLALDSTQKPTLHTVVDTLNQIKEMIEASPESSSPSTSVVSIESSSESCRCWALDSTQRPTLHTVVDTLNQIKEMEASPESSSPSTSVVSIESSSES